MEYKFAFKDVSIFFYENTEEQSVSTTETLKLLNMQISFMIVCISTELNEHIANEHAAFMCFVLLSANI